MKLPLKYGIPVLVALLLASGYTPYGQGKTLLMMLAMGAALWTAFSLPLPRKWRPEEVEETEETGEDAPAPPEPAGTRDAKEGREGRDSAS